MVVGSCPISGDLGRVGHWAGQGRHGDRRLGRCARNDQAGAAGSAGAGTRREERDSREVAVRAPKYGSERAIFVPQELVAILSQHIDAFLPDAAPISFLFGAADGEPLDRNAVHFRWRSAASAAGVDGVRLHDLRHFFASGLIAQGCDVVTVQRALGHASATTTLATYSHLWPNAEDRTRAATASLIRSSLAETADCARTDEVFPQVRGVFSCSRGSPSWSSAPGDRPRRPSPATRRARSPAP
ncbi:MAG: tyrosine-type recombinase/integrase [Marmoricola sp.]